jgi:hypothetical protein
MQDKKIGSIYKMQLADDRFAYCQIIACHSLMGYLVRVFRYCESAEIDLNQVSKLEALFPPVFVGVAMAVRSKNWVLLGKSPVVQEKIPLFRSSNAAQLDDKDDSWSIWDGSTFTARRRLTEVETKLETRSIWGYLALNERIVKVLETEGAPREENFD